MDIKRNNSKQHTRTNANANIKCDPETNHRHQQHQMNWSLISSDKSTLCSCDSNGNSKHPLNTKFTPKTQIYRNVLIISAWNLEWNVHQLVTDFLNSVGIPKKHLLNFICKLNENILGFEFSVQCQSIDYIHFAKQPYKWIHTFESISMAKTYRINFFML